MFRRARPLFVGLKTIEEYDPELTATGVKASA